MKRLIIFFALFLLLLPIASAAFDAIKLGMTSFNTPAPYVVRNSSNPDPSADGWKVLDGDTSSQWQSNGVTQGWLTIDLGAGNATAIRNISIVNFVSDADRSPKDFQFLGGNTYGVWTVLNTSIGITGWSLGVNKSFAFPNDIAYRYYNLSITAIDGDPLQSQITELYLQAGAAAPPAPCTYSGSGDFTIAASNNCTITAAANLAGTNRLVITNSTGPGTISVEANVTNAANISLDRGVRLAIKIGSSITVKR